MITTRLKAAEIEVEQTRVKTRLARSNFQDARESYLVQGGRYEDYVKCSIEYAKAADEHDSASDVYEEAVIEWQTEFARLQNSQRRQVKVQ